MRHSNKAAVQRIMQLLSQMGINRVVYSPGSRNAPFAIELSELENWEVTVAVDERSAGFMALGMAVQLQQPVVLICTSGTAPLNYSPALAEAYYQQIPLIAITADRPSEWIDQGEGQCIRQVEVFRNFVRESCSLSPEESTDADQYNCSVLLDSVKKWASGTRGPWHINVPLREPLYGTSEALVSAFPVVSVGETYSLNELPTWSKDFKKIWILVGQGCATSQLAFELSHWTTQGLAMVLTETHSNVFADSGIHTIDRWFMAHTELERDQMKVDIVITIGGNIISRKIKSFFRSKAVQHWSFQSQPEPVDVFKKCTQVLHQDPVIALANWRGWCQPCEEVKREYSRWAEVIENELNVIQSLPFSDLKAIHHTLLAMPSNSELHMGNSSVVRYIQLFQPLPSVTYRGNRGVSGIDGCTSTALGAAKVTSKPVTLISGDLSFLYDMNAIWQAPWPPHFKVVIINNGGGGIFKIIDGAKDEPYHEMFFETPQQEVDLVKWAAAFGKKAVSVSTEQALLEVLPRFFYAEGPQLLEIKTERMINPVVLQRYFAAFKF